MKGLLKYIQGGLKMITIALPVAITLGGEATFIWLGCNGDAMKSNAFSEARQDTEISQMISDDLDLLQTRLDNKEITTQEYLERTEEYREDDFLYEFMNSKPEKYGEYVKSINKGESELMAGIACGIIFPLIGGLTSAYLYLCTDFAEALADSARDDFDAAQEMKEAKRKKKEEKDYAEEIIR